MAHEFSADIRRDEDVLELSWTGLGPADVYVSEIPHLWTSGPIRRGVGSPLRIEGLSPLRRHFFLLRPVDGGPPLEVAERALPLAGGTNFRDFGGYPAGDGRRVRWGRLYRSGHLARLTEEDRALLEALDIRLNCDFRREEEREKEPSLLPVGTEVLTLTIDPGAASQALAMLSDGIHSAEDMARFMETINEEFVTHAQPQFGRVLEAMLDLDDGALLINCSAGKDRTGFAAALILMALGVPRETILADYLLSARHYPIERELGRIKRRYGHYDEAVVRPMMETRREYLQRALDTIDSRFGGADPYLAELYGIDGAAREALRARYTVPEGGV